MIGILPGLGRDRFTVLRSAGTVGSDDLGNPVVGEWSTLVENVPGTLGTPSARDIRSAAQNDVALEATLATVADVTKRGDRVLVQGREYSVGFVAHLPSGHHRLFLSLVEG